jgi:hypothetical protein
VDDIKMEFDFNYTLETAELQLDSGLKNDISTV